MKRLQAALTLLPDGCVLADVGCDHGLLCAAALKTGKAERVYACDISAKSLEKARKALKGQNAICIESDGLKEVPQDFTAVSVCGMGADTMLGILSDYGGTATMVLQPQTEAERVRKTMTQEFGYRLTQEITARERERFYSVMRFEKGEGELSELQLLFGLHALDPSEELLKMCEKIKKKYSAYPRTEKSARLLNAAEEVLKNAEKGNDKNR